MNIEQLRDQFRSIRATLTKSGRRDWLKYEAKLQELDRPPSPDEWVQQIRRFADETRLKGALKDWQTNRLDHADGWGRDTNPSTQIEGWSETLTTSEKSHLLECQFIKDLETQASYEAWVEDRDW
jgi:hypothetical protein